MKPKLYIVQPVPEDALDMLRGHVEIDMFKPLDRVATYEETAAGVADADYVFAVGENPIDAAMIGAAPRLKQIAVMEIFPVAIDIAAATARNIPVTGLPHSSEITASTAEFTFALMLAVAWRLPENDRLLRAGGWRQYQTQTLPTTRLWDKTLGIVGLGMIGRGVARLARANGMKILYNDRAPLPDAEAELEASFRDLDALFAEADIVCLTPTLTESSKGLIGADLIARMKPSAILINTSRGQVLDEEALAEALINGEIRGAGLDVFRAEFPGPHPGHGPGPIPALHTLENVVLTPHIGTSARETRAWMAEQVAGNILAHIEGRPLQWLLNPEVEGQPAFETERIG